MIVSETVQVPTGDFSSNPTIPDATAESFYFGETPAASHDSGIVSDAVPISLTAQAIALRHALDYVGPDNVQPGLHDEVDALVQAAAAAPVPASPFDIHEMPEDPRCAQVVFTSAEASAVVVGPSLEAPTGGILSMEVSEVRAIQNSYAFIAAIPQDQRRGRGDEVLDVISPQYRDTAIAALYGLLSRRPEDAGLLTHAGTESHPAWQFFAAEAKSMLMVAEGRASGQRMRRMGAALHRLRCSLSRRSTQTVHTA